MSGPRRPGGARGPGHHRGNQGPPERGHGRGGHEADGGHERRGGPEQRRGPEQRDSRQPRPGGRRRAGTPADENPTEVLWLDRAEVEPSTVESYAGDLFEDEYAGDERHRRRDEVGDGDRADRDDADRRSSDDFFDGGFFDDGFDDDGFEESGFDDDGFDDDGFDNDAVGDDGREDERAEPEYYDDERDEPPRSRRRGRGKRLVRWVAALAVLAVVAAAAYFGGRELLGFGYEDYKGPGEGDVVIRVADGETTRQIAQTLAESGVVASAEAFVVAATDNSEIRGVQPGYYLMREKASGEHAVRRIVSDDTRVGHFAIRPGLQLEDLTMPDDSTTPGILSRLSKASCATIDGDKTCVSADKLAKTIKNADLAKLGVPDWAVEDASKGNGLRKLEGLVAPGDYNVRPGSTAKELLRQVMGTSSERMQAAGLAASDGGSDPYKILKIASVIQREGITEDFEKISRVIYNRLDEGMKLRMDSTINYVQDTPTVRTTDKERASDGPYNTYLNKGLPPTPISSPSAEAIKAARHPAEGDWKYFVKCQDSGKSCFSTTYAEHQQAAQKAKERGVY